jgi:hypothetical protein
VDIGEGTEGAVMVVEEVDHITVVEDAVAVVGKRARTSK